MKPLGVAQTVAAFHAKINWKGPKARHQGLNLGRCWLWTGGKSGDGYGRFRFDGKLEGAHRVSYFLAFGRWPKPEVDHKCHRRNCIRPGHLREATRQENARNRAAKLCVRGHRLADPNLHYNKRSGKRRCKTCLRTQHKRK